MAPARKPESSTDTEKSLPAPPPLPPRLLAPAPVVYLGTLGWFAALCVLLVARYVFDAWPPIWLWTALAGTVLGLIGFPVMWWQRSASRRGRRGAQRDL